MFDHCDLTLADLSGSRPYQSEFFGCQLTGSQLNSATSCHLIGGTVELSEATFADCNLAYANHSPDKFIGIVCVVPIVILIYSAT